MSRACELLQSGGPLVAVLAAVSVAIWYSVLLLLWRLGPSRRAERELESCLEAPSDPAALRARLAAWSRAWPGPLARAVRHALGGNGAGGRELRARFEEARQGELPRFRRELLLLRALVAAAPLIGLLGTVRGMVATFSELTGPAALATLGLSGGVREALLTTQVGLLVALPGLAGSHAIARRISALQTALDFIQSRLIGRGNSSAAARGASAREAAP